jgi:hypothetical protein
MLLPQGIVVSSQQEVTLPLISQCKTPTLGPGSVRRKEMNVKAQEKPDRVPFNILRRILLPEVNFCREVRSKTRRGTTVSRRVGGMGV